jgi:hypothetical protein
MRKSKFTERQIVAAIKETGKLSAPRTSANYFI